MSMCGPTILTPSFPQTGSVGGDLTGPLSNTSLAPVAIHGKPSETMPASLDELLIWDAGTGTLRRMTYANLTEGLVSTVTLTTTLANYQLTSEKGTPSGYASLGSDGKVPSAQLPALAITSTFTVASQAAMLALAAQEGDVAIRTDYSPHRPFILTSNSPSTLADWLDISPGTVVTSVNGSTGAVSGFLEATNNLSDVGNVSTARTNLGAAPLASPAFTGTPTGPTAPDGTDTNQLATTAFVQAAVASGGGAPQVWGGCGDATPIAGGSIRLFTFFGTTLGSATNNSYRSPINGIATQLQVHLLDPQPGGGPTTVEVYINGAPSGLVIVIPPGSPAGWYTANVTIALAIGDLVYLRQDNGDPVANGATLGQFSMLVQ